MSRELPPRPNLEHLKKQAKHLLEDLQRTTPDAQLADAQHALARDYGFRNWATLHAHVESTRATFGESSDMDGTNTSPFAGVWIANVAKSSRHPLNQFQRARLDVVVVGDVVTIAHTSVDESGTETRDTNAFVVDDAEHDQGHGYALRAGLRGPRVIETRAWRDGASIGGGTYEVSTDGDTLTITSEDSRIVLERERPR
jgi:hypothetical protein